MIMFSRPENAGCVVFLTLVRLTADQIAIAGGGDGEHRENYEPECRLERGRRSKGIHLYRDRYDFMVFSGAEWNIRCSINWKQP